MKSDKNTISLNITQAILENVADGIITINNKGSILTYNHAAEVIFGYTQDEVLGKNVNMLMFQNDSKAHDKYIHNYVTGGEAGIIGIGRLVKGRKNTGDEIDIELSIGEVKIDDETLFVGIARDVTATRIAEFKTEQVNTLLNAITEAQSRYIQDEEPAKVFDILLNAIVELTNSQLSFIAQSMSAYDEKPVLETIAYYHIDENSRSNLANDKHRKEIDEFLKYVNIQNDAFIMNDIPSDERFKNLSAATFSMHTFMGISLRHGNKLLGILGVANRKFGYDQSIIDFLSPVQITCGSIFQAMQQTLQRKNTQKELRSANEKLAQSIHEMERKNIEISIIRDLDDYLQICRSQTEAFSVTRHTLEKLFPDSSGAIYARNRTNDGLLLMEHWGLEQAIEPIVNHDDCIAARRGRTHMNEQGRAALLCSHIKNIKSRTLCVPFQAQGESFGVLSISGCTSHDDPRVIQGKIELCEGVARQLAMALANLKLRDTLKEQSIKDPLTGLYNRRYIEASIERELYRAERSQDPVAIIMFDIDHFKQINDTYGHDFGDAALVRVSQEISRHCRKSDIPCRFGGEEFMLVMPGLNQKMAYKRAERVLETVRELSLEHNEATIDNITISCGIAIYPSDGDNRDDLFVAADQALYKSKQDGRDRITEARNISIKYKKSA